MGHPSGPNKDSGLYRRHRLRAKRHADDQVRLPRVWRANVLPVLTRYPKSVDTFRRCQIVDPDGHDVRVQHMNFHGALSHMIAVDSTLAEVMIAAVARYDPSMGISTNPDDETMRAAKRHGLPCVGTFFADRAYGPDGKLVGRGTPGAVIENREAVAARVMRFLDDGTVAMTDGRPLRMEASSVLVHSDTPGAAHHARAIRSAVERAGGRIVPLAELFGDAGA